MVIAGIEPGSPGFVLQDTDHMATVICGNRAWFTSSIIKENSKDSQHIDLRTMDVHIRIISYTTLENYKTWDLFYGIFKHFKYKLLIAQVKLGNHDKFQISYMCISLGEGTSRSRNFQLYI